MSFHLNEVMLSVEFPSNHLRHKEIEPGSFIMMKLLQNRLIDTTFFCSFLSSFNKFNQFTEFLLFHTVDHYWFVLNHFHYFCSIFMEIEN